MSWGMAKPRVKTLFWMARPNVETSVGHIAKARELTRRHDRWLRPRPRGDGAGFRCDKRGPLTLPGPGKHSL
jgi:hypothetical protein